MPVNDSRGYELTNADLDVEALVEIVRSHDAGGIVSFLGVVRQRSEGESRSVVSIEYEAYLTMAVPELRAIVAEAERGSGARVAIQHRLGVVPLGEASVAIVAAAAHRGVAFRACEFAIDELKRRVPIWKKENYADGSSAWGDGAVLDVATSTAGRAADPAVSDPFSADARDDG